MMRAVVYHGKGDVRVERVPVPVCGEGGLRVKVEACAVCGSDLKADKSGNPRMRPPIVMGHEFAGVVVESRAGAAFRVGERVVMATSVACGACAYCARGWRNLCANLRPMGFGYDGGMAECVAIPDAAVRGGHVIRVPASADPAAAAGRTVELRRERLRKQRRRRGRPVLVMGAEMGILNAVAARARFLSETRRAGAVRAFDSTVSSTAVEDLAQAVRDATGGLGDVVIVAAGRGAAGAGPEPVAQRGTLCLFASQAKHAEFDSRLIHYHELRDRIERLRAAACRAGGGAARLRAFPTERLVTHRLPLEGFHDTSG